MQAYRTETTLSKDGKLSIQGLPFRKGDVVEVIVLTRQPLTNREPYPLRGKPYSYSKPFEGVAEEEWDAHQ